MTETYKKSQLVAKTLKKIWWFKCKLHGWNKPIKSFAKTKYP